MGQIRHGSARTTKAVRRAIRLSQESIRTLASRYGINPKTAAKWKKRTTLADAPMGPKARAQGAVVGHQALERLARSRQSLQ